MLAWLGARASVWVKAPRGRFDPVTQFSSQVSEVSQACIRAGALIAALPLCGEICRDSQLGREAQRRAITSPSVQAGRMPVSA